MHHSIEELELAGRILAPLRPIWSCNPRDLVRADLRLRITSRRGRSWPTSSFSRSMRRSSTATSARVVSARSKGILVTPRVRLPLAPLVGEGRHRHELRGASAVLFDRLFRHAAPAAGGVWPAAYGLDGERLPDGYARQFLHTASAVRPTGNDRAASRPSRGRPVVLRLGWPSPWGARRRTFAGWRSCSVPPTRRRARSWGHSWRGSLSGARSRAPAWRTVSGFRPWGMRSPKGSWGSTRFLAPPPYLPSAPMKRPRTVGGAGRVGLSHSRCSRCRPSPWGQRCPLLAAAVVRSRSALRSGVGALYTVNLAGGVLGALGVRLRRAAVAGASRGTLAVLGGTAILVASACGPFALAWTREPPAEAPVRAAPQLRETGWPRRSRRGSGWNLVCPPSGLESGPRAAPRGGGVHFRVGRGRDPGGDLLSVASSPPEEQDDPGVRGIDPYWTRIARRCLAIALTVYVGTLVVYVAPLLP